MSDRIVCCPHCGHEFRLEEPQQQRYALREGTRFLVRLLPGERATPHPAGGFIIAHPDHAPKWWREEDGAVLCTTIEPKEPGAGAPVEFYQARSHG